MKILFASSEVAPFSKTGGLADVSAALPPALASLGEQVTVITPAYRSVWSCGRPIEPLDVDLSIPIGTKTVEGTLLRSTLPAGPQGSEAVPVLLVQQDDYYDRDGLYGTPEGDYVDNCERFVFFSRAVLEAARKLELTVDVVHCHDWQSALIPAYLQIEYRDCPGLERAGSLFTIHNLAFQGQFWHWDMLLTGLDWKYFNWRQLEFHGKLNLLKAGLVFADRLNTVSPRYAEEIQTAAFGAGLEGVLQHRRAVLSGILNGVDYRVWNPATDPYLPQTYDPSCVESGKAACKSALQSELRLRPAANAPLVAFVGRLTEQKGIDLIVDVLPEWTRTTDVQWVVLGTGEPRFHQALLGLAERFPHKLAVRLEFSERLAHRIEGGADLFLMPSRFEPCGLSQMYSMKYGTVPVVRATGGLVDTVVDATPQALAEGRATGFVFSECSPLALSEALRRACELYRRPHQWRQLQATCLQQDWSWERSAREYQALYRRICERRVQAAAV